MAEKVSQSGEVELLATMASTGDREALLALYDRFADRLWTHIDIKCGGIWGVADDVTQETWARVLVQIRNFDPARGRFIGWLYRIADGIYADMVRREWSKRRDVELKAHQLACGDSEEDPAPSPEAMAVANATCQRIADAINSLPRKQRQVVVAVCMEELAVTEAAEVLGMSYGAVTSAQWRALRRLEQLLSDLVPNGAVRSTRTGHEMMKEAADVRSSA